jgi:hypothetical protein
VAGVIIIMMIAVVAVVLKKRQNSGRKKQPAPLKRQEPTPMKRKETMLRCEVCGHTQYEGDWEKAMDAQAKRMGAGGFINIGAEPQCLNCGSRELTDLSRVVPPKEEPQFIADAAEEIVSIMEPYFRRGVSLGTGVDERLVAIGESLYEKGGDDAMMQAFKKARNLAHRRYGYTGTNRYLEMTWDGIGMWRG